MTRNHGTVMSLSYDAPCPKVGETWGDEREGGGHLHRRGRKDGRGEKVDEREGTRVSLT